MFGYSYTLTTNRDFTSQEIVSLAQWFAKTCDSCLLVEERGGSGQLHLHAGTQQKQKTTGEVTRRLTKVYADLQIPFTKGVSIKVRKTTDQIGWFHYLTKDMQPDQVPVLIFGWQMTWIQQQCKDNLKKIPHKMVRGDDYVLNMVVAPNLMIAYAKRVGLPIHGKECFKQIVCQMAEEGYQMHNLKFRILYAQILARSGDYRPLKSLLDSELQFLE